MDPRKSLEPQHLDYIDALRGLAFLGVLCTHTIGCIGHFPSHEFFSSGAYGVQLFFLASAITLCYSSSRRVQFDHYPWLSFFIRRFFRIAPLFWLAMAFYWTCPHTWPEFMHQTDPSSGIRPYYFVLTALFLHGWRPETINSIVPGGWSIAVEMTFYLLFPLCFYYINSLRKAALAVLISVVLAHAAIIGVHQSFLGDAAGYESAGKFFAHHWFPAQAPTFFIGFALFYLLKHDVGIRLIRSPFWSRMLFIFCLMVYPTALFGSDELIPQDVIIVMLLAGFVLAIASNSIPYVVNPLICYIGKISFSCYIVHFAMLVIALRLFGFDLHLHTHDAGSSVPNFLNFVKLVATTLILTVIVATITYHLIEQPGIALGRRLIKWLNNRPIPASTTVEIPVMTYGDGALIKHEPAAVPPPDSAR
jgi:peptidoglycan/LPS O-acetylase OafA/YrhL